MTFTQISLSSISWGHSVFCVQTVIKMLKNSLVPFYSHSWQRWLLGKSKDSFCFLAISRCYGPKLLITTKCEHKNKYFHSQRAFRLKTITFFFNFAYFCSQSHRIAMTHLNMQIKYADWLLEYSDSSLASNAVVFIFRSETRKLKGKQ